MSLQAWTPPSRRQREKRLQPRRQHPFAVAPYTREWAHVSRMPSVVRSPHLYGRKIRETCLLIDTRQHTKKAKGVCHAKLCLLRDRRGKRAPTDFGLCLELCSLFQNARPRVGNRAVGETKHAERRAEEAWRCGLCVLRPEMTAGVRVGRESRLRQGPLPPKTSASGRRAMNI